MSSTTTVVHPRLEHDLPTGLVWRHFYIALDLKGENWTITSGPSTAVRYLAGAGGGSAPFQNMIGCLRRG